MNLDRLGEHQATATQHFIRFSRLRSQTYIPLVWGRGTVSIVLVHYSANSSNLARKEILAEYGMSL